MAHAKPKTPPPQQMGQGPLGLVVANHASALPGPYLARPEQAVARDVTAAAWIRVGPRPYRPLARRGRSHAGCVRPI